MIILSITSLLRNIVFILFIIIVFRWILAIFRVNSSIKNTKTQTHQPKDEVIIRFNNKGEKIIDKSKGEYVDFEEVD